ncbi:MAG: hypothetical protein MJ239_06425 [Bacilli bacterium]|nr:hypothetical protein [Bacilli bacterium]
MSKKPFIPFALAAMLLTACGGGQSSVPSSTTSESVPTSIPSEVPSLPTSDPTSTPTSIPSSEETSESSAEKIFVVVNVVKGAADVELVKDKGRAVPGETVTLTITAKNGGMFVDVVTATGSDGAAIALTKNGDTYSYALPEDGTIDVSVTVAGKNVTATVVDAKDLLTSISMKKFGETEFTQVEKKDGAYALYYGARVKVALHEVGYITPTGITVGSATYALNEGVAEFAVNPEVGDDMSITITVTYKDNTPKVGEYSIEYRNSAHLTATALDEEARTLTSLDMNDIFYISVKSENPEDYFVRELKVWGLTDVSTGTKGFAEVKYDEELGLYSCKTPFAADKNIVIELTESYAGVLRDTPLPGNYLTLSLTGGNQVNEVFDKRKLIIEESGEMAYSDGGHQTIIETYDKTTGIARTPTLTSFYTGNNMILFDDYQDASQPFSSAFGTCDVLGVKMKEKTDTEDMYSLSEEQFKIEGDFYVIASILRNDEIYATCFINYKTKTANFGVDIELHSNKKLGEAKEVVEITTEAGDKTVFGYVGDGAISERIMCGEYFGTYTDGTNTLFLHGGNKADYNGAEYDVTNIGACFTLENVDKIVEVSLDKATRSLTVTSEKEKGAVVVSFRGQTYSGQYYDDWEEGKMPIKIVFDDSEAITGIMWLCYNNRYPFPFVGTVEGSVLKLEFVQYATDGTTKIVDSGKIGATLDWEIGEGTLKLLSGTKFGKTGTYSLLNSKNSGLTINKQ